MILNEFFNLPQVFEKDMNEGVMSEIDAELRNIVANEDFDTLYELFTANTPAGKFVQDMYDDVVIDHRLHPDDDFERIEEIVFDRLVDKFGEQGVAEGKRNKQRRLNEALLLEDPVYRKFKGLSQYIVEYKMSEKQILDVFAQAEAGMTDRGTGANRTWAGKGKDATVDFAKDLSGAVKGVLDSVQNSVPVSAVDTAYDQATDALANVAGGQKGAVMDAIKKYRNLVKEYPKTAGFAKAALVAIAGLATGGAGLPAIAGLTYALDSAIKGDKLSSVLGKGAGAAALSAAAQGLHGGATQAGPADTKAFTNLNQMGDYTGDYVDMPPGSDAVVPPPVPDLATYTVQQGDTLSQIAQANNTSVQELIGLNPQLAAASKATAGQGLNPDVIFPGQQITLPPGAAGTDVYAGGVGTSSNTMADIARGQVPNSPISQAMAAKGQAAADATSGRADNLANMTQQAGGAPIDYTQAGPMSTDSLGQKLEYGIPVTDAGNFVPPNPNLPADELAKQTAAYNSWKADFMKRNPNIYIDANGNQMQIPGRMTLPAEVNESVKIKIIPANELIDKRLTLMSWTLNESIGKQSNRSVNLTAAGALTVFENINRYRLALMEKAGVPGSTRPEYYRPDMMSVPAKADKKPGLIGRGLNWLDKKAGQVGSAISNVGHQFTTNVTKEKLKMNWHQAGKPSDSDALAAWLVKQGVPQEVVTSVYTKMGIPYTAPAAPQPAAEPTAAAKPDAITKAKDELALMKKATASLQGGPALTPQELEKVNAYRTSQGQPPIPASTKTAAPAGGKFPGEDPQGPGYIGRREVARRQAARDAEAAKKPAAPNFAQQSGGYKNVTYAPATYSANMKPTGAAKAPPAKNAAGGESDQLSKDEYIKRIGAPNLPEAKKPSKEADYGDDYQDMVKRVAAQEKRKQQQQQPKQPVRESRRALLKQIIQS